MSDATLPETPPANANDQASNTTDGSESVAQRVEKSIVERVEWLETELRKLLRLPEDAPLD